jgi:hypothetical protein
MFPTRYFTLRYWAARYFPRSATATTLTAAFISVRDHAFSVAGPRNDYMES